MKFATLEQLKRFQDHEIALANVKVSTASFFELQPTETNKRYS